MEKCVEKGVQARVDGKYENDSGGYPYPTVNIGFLVVWIVKNFLTNWKYCSSTTTQEILRDLEQATKSVKVLLTEVSKSKKFFKYDRWTDAVVCEGSSEG